MVSAYLASQCKNRQGASLVMEDLNRQQLILAIAGLPITGQWGAREDATSKLLEAKASLTRIKQRGAYLQQADLEVSP